MIIIDWRSEPLSSYPSQEKEVLFLISRYEFFFLLVEQFSIISKIVKSPASVLELSKMHQLVLVERYMN